MPVMLRCSNALPPAQSYDYWAAIGDPPPQLDVGQRCPGIGDAIERAFEDVASDWWEIGRALSADVNADLGHTPACVANLSDFGLMLAWSVLARRWSEGSHRILLVTDDPWVFRHLTRISEIDAGRAPVLFRAAAKRYFRGYIARFWSAARFSISALQLRSHRRQIPTMHTAMLVYGHPNSTADGEDGYFGSLMRELPDINRVLHVDCPPARARALSADGRTVSLHGWGSVFSAMRLIFAYWRPAGRWRSHPAGWLVRRAACLEAGTAAGAAIRWQQVCQRNWIRSCRPSQVIWPWENHSWERSFVRMCRNERVRPLGYQHSVVGRQMLNYAPKSNPDGMSSIPDKVLCAGNATADQLIKWGVPADRISVGGARRVSSDAAPEFSRDAPVFMPLPFDRRVSSEMLAAARSVQDREFLVKEHPMSPHPFPETDTLRRTDRNLSQQPALSAVVYAASTVGLESLIAGIPTLRYQPQSCMAIDILPEGQNVKTVDIGTLEDALKNLPPAVAIPRSSFFAEVDQGLWRSFLGTEPHDGK